MHPAVAAPSRHRVTDCLRELHARHADIGLRRSGATPCRCTRAPSPHRRCARRRRPPRPLRASGSAPSAARPRIRAAHPLYRHARAGPWRAISRAGSMRPRRHDVLFARILAVGGLPQAPQCRRRTWPALKSGKAANDVDLDADLLDPVADLQLGWPGRAGAAAARFGLRPRRASLQRRRTQRARVGVARFGLRVLGPGIGVGWRSQWQLWPLRPSRCARGPVAPVSPHRHTRRRSCRAAWHARWRRLAPPCAARSWPICRWA